jgi:dCMP deaminase
MYVTASPCNMCLKQIINAGIVKIIAKEVYPDKMSKEMLKQSGIDFELYNKTEE